MGAARDADGVPFAEACRLTRVGPARFRAALTEDWYQGRGVYGGLIGAILARAIEAQAPAHPLRTLSVSYLAPAVAGEAEVETSVEREGRSVLTCLARLRRDGAPVATAMATCAKPRRSRLDLVARPRPEMPPAAAVPSGPEALYVPSFCRHLEFRQALGAPAFSGAESAHVAGWCRLREPVDPSAALLVALLDAWAPAALCLSPEWSGAATVDSSVQLLAPIPDVAPDAFWAFEARATVVEGGYADELATLWAPDGTPVASSRQLVALFG